MKFLCVECDEPMSLEEAHGPDEGAMTVVFQCPSCERETAMLTNPMETQVVRSLGVSIGDGETTSSGPMEMVQSSLTGQDVSADEPDGENTGDSDSKCPFTDVVRSAEEEQDGQPSSSGDPQWTADAENRLERIPSFVRSMARSSIEEHAREQVYDTIDTSVMDEIKGEFGM